MSRVKATLLLYLERDFFAYPDGLMMRNYLDFLSTLENGATPEGRCRR